MQSKLYFVPAVAVAALIGLSGCGSSSNADAAPKSPHSSHTMSPMSPSTSTAPSTAPMGTAPMGSMAMITIKSFAYMGTMTVKPGAMVMVENDDTETHTLTSDTAGQFNVSITPGGGKAMFNAPTKAGTYAYHCSFHSNMHGTLIVK